MTTQVAKWGNSQGIRLSKRILQIAGLSINDSVEVIADKNQLVIKPVFRKSLTWFLEGYDGELDRYNWGETDEPKGREIL